MKMTRNSRRQNLILAITLSIGLCFTSSASAEIFLLDSSGKVLSEIGRLGYAQVSTINSSQAYSINDAGQVAGTFYRDISQASFITGPNGMGMTDLGTLGGNRSFASDINDAGQVVGWSLGLDGFHGFITGPNGVGMTDLNSLASLPGGYVITNGIGINNAGQVLVVAYIPEPETYALMIAGLGLIGFVAWRQKSGNRIQY